MKANIVLLILAIVNLQLSTSAQVEKSFMYNGFSFKSFSIPLTKTEIAKIDIVSNSSNLSTTKFFEVNSTKFTANFFSCSASIENTLHEPLGLFISNGKEIQSLNLNEGEGNFFLKPNGIISCNKNAIEITSSENFQYTEGISWAIQSGPLLLDNGKMHKSFNVSSTNLNQRVGVGISVTDDIPEVVFIIAIDKVNFYTFASVFKDKFGCKNALCLESGRSFARFPSNNNVNYNDDVLGNLFVYSDKKNQNISSNSKITIPLKRNSNNQYEIPVTLNSTIHETCVFDSGVNEVTLSTKSALALFQSGSIGKSNCVGTKTQQYADGSIAFCDVFTIEEINIGGFLLKNITASISDSNDAHIRLGKNALQKIGKYNIDNVSHSLIIE